MSNGKIDPEGMRQRLFDLANVHFETEWINTELKHEKVGWFGRLIHWIKGGHDQYDIDQVSAKIVQVVNKEGLFGKEDVDTLKNVEKNLRRKASKLGEALTAIETAIDRLEKLPSKEEQEAQRLQKQAEAREARQSEVQERKREANKRENTHFLEAAIRDHGREAVDRAFKRLGGDLERQIKNGEVQLNQGDRYIKFLYIVGQEEKELGK